MKIIFINLLLAVSTQALAQATLSANDSLLLGTWKGTSTCQIKPSPCKDEINVYHITKGGKPNVFHVLANKLVNEKEENMGEGDYIFDPKNKTLTSRDDRYEIMVNLTVIGTRIDGTLVYQGKVYRIINLSKIPNR